MPTATASSSLDGRPVRTAPPACPALRTRSGRVHDHRQRRTLPGQQRRQAAASVLPLIDCLHGPHYAVRADAATSRDMQAARTCRVDLCHRFCRRTCVVRVRSRQGEQPVGRVQALLRAEPPVGHRDERA
jgi:hypothetical protein